MKKVFIVNGSGAYRALFQTLGYDITNDLKEASLVCFTGGEDVSPNLYNDDKHQATFNSPIRDAQEALIFADALADATPMVGICRGAQFLNVMSGGRMYQHVSEHTRSHMLEDVQTGQQVFVSSTHHQMMMPNGDAEIVAVSHLGGYREWYDGHQFKRDESNTDYEVVYYKATHCLCFQPHPEFGGKEYEDMQKYFASLLQRYLEQ